MKLRLPNLLDWSDFPSHWHLYVNSLLLILLFPALPVCKSATRINEPAPIEMGYHVLPAPMTDLFLRCPGLDIGPNAPGWMQKLLSDPDWNQPYIEPRATKPMSAPSTEQLLELTRERMANPPVLEPRAAAPAGPAPKLVP